MASLFEVLEELSPAGPIKSQFPQTMENVGQNYGFMLYRTQIPSMYSNKQVELEIAGLRDRGIIFVGQVVHDSTFLKHLSFIVDKALRIHAYVFIPPFWIKGQLKRELPTRYFQNQPKVIQMQLFLNSIILGLCSWLQGTVLCF